MQAKSHRNNNRTVEPWHDSTMKHRHNHTKILLATLLIVALATSCKQKQSSETPPPPETDTVAEEVPPKDTTYRISLLFAGDLMQHDSQFKMALQDDGTYDYSECFQYVKHEIESADIAVANFETTLAGPPYHGYPNFCAPDKYLVDCKTAGFDIMLTANNHTCDSTCPKRQAVCQGAFNRHICAEGGNYALRKVCGVACLKY